MSALYWYSTVYEYSRGESSLNILVIIGPGNAY